MKKALHIKIQIFSIQKILNMGNISGVKHLLYLCLYAIWSTDLLLVHGQVIETYPKNVTVAEG